DRGAWWARSFTHLYPMVPRRHQVEVNLDALRRIGLQPDLPERKVLFIPGAEAERRVQTLVPEAFIHLHPASRWHFKCWPAAQNAALIDRLAADGWTLVITAAPDGAEVAFVEQILARTTSAPVNLAGKLSIKELG